MEFLIEMIKLFFDSFKFAVRDLMLFPGTNLKRVFNISFSISTLSLFCWVFKLPQFIDWRGGMIGTAIIGLVILVSMKEENK